MPDRPRAVSSNTAPAAMLHGGQPTHGAQEGGGNQQTSKLPVREYEGERCTGVRVCGRGRESGGGPGHEQVYRADSIVIGRSMPTLLPCISAGFPAQHRQDDHDYRRKRSLWRRLAVCRRSLDPALRRPQSARVISACTRARGQARTHAHRGKVTHVA